MAGFVAAEDACALKVRLGDEENFDNSFGIAGLGSNGKFVFW